MAVVEVMGAGMVVVLGIGRRSCGGDWVVRGG